MHYLSGYLDKNIHCSSCGTEHRSRTCVLAIGDGALRGLPALMSGHGFAGHGLVVGDEDGFQRSGSAVNAMLNSSCHSFERLTLPASDGPELNQSALRTLRRCLRGAEPRWLIAVGGKNTGRLVKLATVKHSIPCIAVVTESDCGEWLSPELRGIYNGSLYLRRNLPPPVGLVADTGRMEGGKAVHRRAVARACAVIAAEPERRLDAMLSRKSRCFRAERLLANESLRFFSRLDGGDEAASVEAAVRLLLLAGVLEQWTGGEFAADGGAGAVEFAADACFPESLPAAGACSYGICRLLSRYRRTVTSRRSLRLKLPEESDTCALFAEAARRGIEADEEVRHQRLKRIENARAFISKLDGADFRRSAARLAETEPRLKKLLKKWGLPLSDSDMNWSRDDGALAQRMAGIFTSHWSLLDLKGA